MLTDAQRAGMCHDANEVYQREIAALPTLVGRVVQTKYAIATHVPEAIEVTTANGIQVKPGDLRPFLDAEDRLGVLYAAELCGKSIIAAVQAAKTKWPDLPLVYAETWSLQVLFTLPTKPYPGRTTIVECCSVDIRGAVLPEIMVERLPDHRPGAVA
jgi:hypothetical protein